VLKLFSHRYLTSLCAIAVVTIGLAPFEAFLNPTTVALSLLLAVLLAATFFGRNPALLAALLAALCFNFFFLPPLYTLTIADPQNWAALAAFLVTAIVAGELSAIAARRADEAERLYAELQTAFEEASQAEALRQSEKLKSALLDAVTHNLRTPLTSIKAAATSLLDDEREGEFHLDCEARTEFLEIINEETDRLNCFIEGIIELARAEAGAMRSGKNWSAVDEIVLDALNRAATHLGNRTVKFEIEKELPTVRADAKALAEVVYTLLDNAAKYSPENSAVKITARRLSEAVEIAVTDEGIGITPELRTRVFDKFFRAARDQKTAEGLGLGLSIARAIVEAHNGKIWITDGDCERGTKVIFTVPVGDE
jgi:K+-sensing histidine kinase KdpD